MPNEQYKQWRQWGSTHHFPQLVLSPNPPDVLRAGEVAWTRFFGRERDPSRVQATYARTQAAYARMSRWDALLSSCPSDHQRSDEGQEDCLEGEAHIS